MASPEEQAVIDAEMAKSAAPVVPSVTLTRGNESLSVPEGEKGDYLAQGWDDPRFAEGGEYNPTLSGTLDNILARGEALDRGATGGLGGLVGSVGAGIGASLAEDDTGIPRNVQGAEGQSTFRRGFDAAEMDRRRRAEALGLEGIGWEGAGTIATLGAGAAAKTGGLGAAALARSPVALAEQLGTKAAAKILGEAAAEGAVAGVGKTVLARGAAGGVEGALTGGLMTSVENVDLALKDPGEAAQNVLLGTLVGGGMGSVLGGGFGLVEGVARNAAPVVREQIAKWGEKAPPVPAVRAVGVDDALQANATRPMTSAQVPDPERSYAGNWLAKHDALAGGEDQAVQEGSRAVTRGLSDLEVLDQRFSSEAGIAQKQLVNRAALENGFAKDLVERLDPEDVAFSDSLRLQSADAATRRDAASSALDDLTSRHRQALDAEAEARRALDEAVNPSNVDPERLSFAESTLMQAEEAESTARQAIEGSSGGKSLVDSIESIQGPLPKMEGQSNRVFVSQIADDLGISDDEAKRLLTQLSKDKKVGLSRLDLVRAIEDKPELQAHLARSTMKGAGNAEFNLAEIRPGALEELRGLKVGKGADDSALRDAYAQAQKQLVSAQEAFQAAQAPAGKVRRPSAQELAPYRQALKDAQRNAKSLTKELDRVKSTYSSVDEELGTLNRSMLEAPEPRRMSRLESESRDMFDGLLTGIDAELNKVAGPEADNLLTLRKRVVDHANKTVAAFKTGDFGTAHNLMDQGLKHSLADTVNRTGSSEVERFVKDIYNVPRSFLENAKVWGDDIAGRNALANPTFHDMLVASGDAGYKSLYKVGGEANLDGWGNRREGNSASVGALMRQLGEDTGESTEVGLRRALRTRVADAKNRGAAWGSEAAPALADDIAKLQTHLEDVLDNTAIVRRDAASAKQSLKAGQLGFGAMAAASAVGAVPMVGIPMVAGRWLLGAVAQNRTNIARSVAAGAAKLVSAGVRAAENVGGPMNQTFGRRIGAEQRKAALRESGTSREQAIADAQARLDVSHPKSRELAAEAQRTNMVSPGLGDAIMQKRLEIDQYIVAHLPQTPSPAVFSPRGRLTNAAAVSLDRILMATNNPAKTFARITDGAATPEDLDAMRRLFPVPYQAMTDSIMAEIQANPRRVKSPSLQMYLSRIVGQPLTPALMTIAKSQERAKRATAGAEDAGKPMDGGDGVTARAPIQLSTDPNEVYGSRADHILSGS